MIGPFQATWVAGLLVCGMGVACWDKVAAAGDSRWMKCGWAGWVMFGFAMIPSCS